MLEGERLKTATDNRSGGEVKIRGGKKNNLESANAAELLMLLLPPPPLATPMWSMNSQAWFALSKTSLLNEAPTIAQN